MEAFKVIVRGRVFTVPLTEITDWTPNFIEDESKTVMEDNDPCVNDNGVVDLEDVQLGNSVDVESWKEDEQSQGVPNTFQQEHFKGVSNHDVLVSKDPFCIYDVLQNVIKV